MNRKNYKYMEHYREKKILVYGEGREWWWEIVKDEQSKNSPTSYFSVQAALSNARKHIDKKVI